MKSHNQVAEIRHVQFLTMGRGTMSITLHKQIEVRRNEMRAPGEQSPGSADSGSEDDGLCGEVAAAPGAPASIQQTVLDQPGVELLARYLQELGGIGFVVAGDLQDPLDELAFGLVEGFGRSVGELADRRGLALSISGAAADHKRGGLQLDAPDVLWQILHTNPGAAAESERAFD